MRVDFQGFPVGTVTRVEPTSIWVVLVYLGRPQNTVVVKPGSIHCGTKMQSFTGASTCRKIPATLFVVLGTNSPTEDFCIKYILNHTVGSHIAGNVNILDIVTIVPVIEGG